MSQMTINNSIFATLAPPAKPAIGAIHIDSLSNQLQIYDGSKWVAITVPSPSIKKQQSIEELCEMHPGLAELKKELDETQQRFDAYLALIRE